MCKMAVKNNKNVWKITTAEDHAKGNEITRIDLMNSILYQNSKDNIKRQKELETLYNSILSTERQENSYISRVKVSGRSWDSLKTCLEPV